MGQTITDERWISSMKALLRSVDHDHIQSYSISIVPEGLKESNIKDPVKKEEESNKDDNASYMPRVVSMGPRFKGTREDLLLMEEVKLRCMLSLIHRAGRKGDADTYVEKCSRVIWNLDAEIRASYVADINLIKTPDLAKIMLVDGCFLLELLISKGLLNGELEVELPSRLITPSPAPQVLQNEEVLSDLILFENQIPICVLHELSQTLFPDVFEENLKATRINNLALAIFGYSLPRVQTSEAPHILDVVHYFVNYKEESTQIRTNANHVVDIPSSNPKLKRCASRLRAAGVTIKAAQETESRVSCFSFMRNCFGGTLIRLGNIIITTTRQVDAPPREIKGLDFNFKFEGGKLEIAQLHIQKTTKATWRNIIAWEHHHKKGRRKSPNGKFTSAALIFDGLICCAADVKLLKDKNVIVDHAEMSNEELEAFFHTMSFGVDHGVVDSNYVKLVSDLNNYSKAFFLMQMWRVFWHLFGWSLQWLIKWMSKNYRLVLSFVAFLTLVQTVYAMLAYHHPT